MLIDRGGPALLEHPGHERLDAVRDAQQVHADHALPVFDRGRLDVAGVADARVVVQDVDATRLAEHLLGERLDCIGVRHVELVGGGPPARGLDQPCNLLRALEVQVGDVQARAVPPEEDGRGAADSRACAGDDGGLAG